MTCKSLLGPFLLLVTVPFAVGCKSHEARNETIWSAQTTSPDGKLAALAHTEHTNRGFGTDAQWTIVEIKQNFDSAKPIEVLEIDEGPESVRNLTMTWQSPSQLHIAYKGGEEIMFQAVKVLGAQISVERIPD